MASVASVVNKPKGHTRGCFDERDGRPTCMSREGGFSAHPVDAELALAVSRGNVEVVAAGSDPWALLRRGEPHAQCHDGGHCNICCAWRNLRR
jgi:hypothetical protein